MKAYFGYEYIVPGVMNTIKLGVIAGKVRKQFEIGERRRVDERLMASTFKGIHDPNYVDAFDYGIEPFCSASGIDWNMAMRASVFAQNSAQIDAVNALLGGENIVSNIANGFHHATYYKGGGFCTFNGLALVAYVFDELKILVLDCDEHGGNGTDELSLDLKNLYNFSIFGSQFGFVGYGDRSIGVNVSGVDVKGWSLYSSALDRAFSFIDEVKPDVVIYQAGMDCHIGDPLSTVNLTTEQIVARDNFVFKSLSDRKIKTLFVMAGGYQPLDIVSSLHFGTFISAASFYVE